MAIRDILLHLDNRASCPERIELAIRLAKAHQAQLAGLYVTALPFFSLHHSAAEADRQQARQLFIERTTGRGQEAEWLEMDSAASGVGMSEAINFHAHYRDLLIVGQTCDGAEQREIPVDLPERAVLGAGRPVLIVPYTSDIDSVGERVLLAWRGGPESARAVNDAMPLLKKAKAVNVLSVKTAGGDGELAPASGDLVAYLARHGVTASAEQVEPGGLAVGDILLNHASDLGSDLLVMGAYAQTRRGIPTLGEVGRHLLKYMTIPVLMSH